MQQKTYWTLAEDLRLPKSEEIPGREEKMVEE